jgi:cell division protein FtsZ
MAEFQDAAKVITESIDKDARVIIGTILDEGMKKGELKITVIATGFPHEVSKKSSLFAGNSHLFTRTPAPEANLAPQQAPEPRVAPMVQKPEKPADAEVSDAEPIEDDIDSFGAIPAFLRRNKK